MADPTRESAFDLLTMVLERRRTLEDALDALPAQQSCDRAAGHRLAASVLRRIGTLDAILEPFQRKEPPQPVRNILRIGAAGLLFLDTPAHAAVATAVALAKARGLTPFAGLMNAVLRKVAAAGAMALEDLDPPRLDTPAWLWTSWGDAARAIATAHQLEAPVDVTLNPAAGSWPELESPASSDPPGASQRESTTIPGSVDADEVAGHPGGQLLPTGSLRFPAGTPVAALAGISRGAMWVQDAAAALPARLLAARAGERVADLCAAPGGKTGQLAASGAVVTALDRDPIRLQRLISNLGKWQLHAEVIAADATVWVPPAPFDAILLDAPCSATGTIRRHPDVMRLKRARDVQAMTEIQDRLLAAGLAMLRRGGRLIYSVCSLQPDECAPRVAAAVARGHAGQGPVIRHQPFSRAELAVLPESLTPDGFLRTHPGMWADRGGMDGFFAARMIRA